MAPLIAAAAVLLLGLAWWLRRRTGLPWAPIVSSDAGWEQPQRALVASEYGLVGKPDYVVRTRHGLIPVEVKPGRTAAQPYDSDLMQLAAYCLLIEATTGRAPAYGLLRYRSQTFRLRYTAAVRRELLEIIAALGADLRAADVRRSHNQPGRCGGCGFTTICSEALR